ncbi:MAG TPA: hypothetical protein PLB55_03025 [Prosthecobacter sp.]|nr:hypothetical protein [Prosthecobacter sp.]
MKSLFDALCAQAAELGAFSVSIRDMPIYKDELSCSLPLHQDVLLPLIASSAGCRLYGPVTAPDLTACVESRWSPCGRNTFELANMRDPIRGQEMVWNASGGIRGSIVLAISHFAALECFKTISIHASKPYCMSSFRQLKKGHTPAALREAQKHARDGLVAICLPSSNGCQWLDVFAAPHLLPDLMRPCFESGDNRKFGIVD